MINSASEQNHRIQLNGRSLQQVSSFSYLGTTIEYNGKIDKEITKCIGKAGNLYNTLKNTFLRNIRTQVYQRLVRASKT